MTAISPVPISTFDAAAFLTILHPEDPDPFIRDADFIRYYQSKHDIVAELQPKSICEIGVRAGYSAWAMLTAAPSADYLGVDIDDSRWGGRGGFMKHAKEIIKALPDPFHPRRGFTVADSLDITTTLGGWEFWHVDGDHSLAGALSDLLLARRSGAKWMLVDDYDYIRDVRIACDCFAARFATDIYSSAMPHTPEFTVRRIDDGGFRGQVLFERIAPPRINT